MDPSNAVPPPPPDRTRWLVDRASSGDEAALGALLEQHLPGLRTFLRLRMGKELRSKEASTDLVQSACREVLEHLDRYRHHSENGFKRWLYATALRKLKNRLEYYRAAKRATAREVPADALTSDDQELVRCYARICTPSGELMRREQVERIEAAFDRLPEHYREVILLSRVTGLLHREVAAAMGRSEVATRSLLHRALAALSEAVAGLE